MKRLALGLALLAPGHAETADDDLPIGIEVVTGFRTDYVYRGFQLAGSLIDVQAEAEVALSDKWLLNLGGYYGSATGDGDFSEAAAFFDLRYEAEQWTAAFGTTWHDYQDSFFEDGLDLAPSFTWHLTDDLDLGTGVAYDTGDGGWYGHLEATWSKPTGREPNESETTVATRTAATATMRTTTRRRVPTAVGARRAVATVVVTGPSLPLPRAGRRSR